MSKFAIERGPAIAFWLLALAAQMSGFTNVALALAITGVAIFFLIAPAYHHFRVWRIRRRETGRPMTIPQLVLLAGIFGTWLFVTVGLAAGAWLILTGQGLAVGSSAIGGAQDDGPMQWFRNLQMEGGPPTGRNVFALTFRGVNSSQNEVELKAGSIISAVNGSKIALEIVAQNELVAVTDIELIPPGAPVSLVAKFGPADPNAPGKVLGLSAQDFIATWKQFSLNVQDDTKPYRISFNEGDLAPFFPGMVGPHVTKKKAQAK